MARDNRENSSTTPIKAKQQLPGDAPIIRNVINQKSPEIIIFADRGLVVLHRQFPHRAHRWQFAELRINAAVGVTGARDKTLDAAGNRLIQGWVFAQLHHVLVQLLPRVAPISWSSR